MGVWLTELRRNLPRDVVLHVVGTKADIVARDSTARQVPFERCIAYVAENLAPGQGNTPPPTAAATPFHGPLSVMPSSSPAAAAAAAAAISSGANPVSSVDPHSPSSKRSSGFWAQEVGWDACHEISAENGEGVEEVFRVVTRKLVEQNRKIQQALLMATATPAATPGGFESGGDGGYFEGMNARGSFRVGRDRRSWLFSPAFSPAVTIEQARGQDHPDQDAHLKPQKKCC
jgi:hypothetical protein